MRKDSAAQFSKTTVILHWLIAILMIALLAVGVYMTENHDYSLYPLHKSFGVLVLIFACYRAYWRFKNGWPTPASQYKAIEHTLAVAAHWVLLLGTLLMPVSGIILSSMGGHNVPFFGFDLIHAVHDPANPSEVIARNAELSEAAGEVHEIIGYLLIAVIILHIAGALKHHIIDKDGTLQRMRGKSIS